MKHKTNGEVHLNWGIATFILTVSVAFIFYCLGEADAREEAVNSGAAEWYWNPHLEKRFHFLPARGASPIRFDGIRIEGNRFEKAP